MTIRTTPRRPPRLRLPHLILIPAISAILVILIMSVTSAYYAQGVWLANTALEFNRDAAEELGDNLGALARSIKQDLVAKAIQLRILPQGSGGRAQDILNQWFVVEPLYDSMAILGGRGEWAIVAPDTGATRQAWRAALAGLDGPCEHSGAGARTVDGVSGPGIVIFQAISRGDATPAGCLAVRFHPQTSPVFTKRVSLLFPHQNTQVFLLDRVGRVLFQSGGRPAVSAHAGTDSVSAWDSAFVRRVIPDSGQVFPGSVRYVDAAGIEYLAGYDEVPEFGWRVVVQRPAAPILDVRDTWLGQGLLYMIGPLGLLLYVLWYLSRKLSKPLRAIAAIVSDVAGTGLKEDQGGGTRSAAERIRSVPCWYYEACLIRQALLDGIGAVRSRVAVLQDEAYQDALTGLGNRRALDETLRVLAEGAGPFAAVSLDIDLFKRINDRHGHDVGDQAIRSVADWLRQQARAGDFLFRVGGEEFLALLPDASIATAHSFAERVRSGISGAVILPGEPLTVSVGVALSAGTSGQATLKAADEALYQAKRRGRNQVSVAVAYGAEISLGADSPTGEVVDGACGTGA